MILGSSVRLLDLVALGVGAQLDADQNGETNGGLGNAKEVVVVRTSERPVVA